MREDNIGYASLVDELIMRSIDLEYSDCERPTKTPVERVPGFLEIVSTHIGTYSSTLNEIETAAYLPFLLI